MTSCTQFKRGHSRAAHILIRLGELGASITRRTALFDNVLYDFLQTLVVILVTRDPWWSPDMQTPWMAKDVVPQILISFETLVHGHVETTKHDGDKP